MRNVTIISKVINRTKEDQYVPIVEVQSVPADVYSEIHQHNQNLQAHEGIQQKIAADMAEALVPYAKKADVERQILALEVEEDGNIYVLVGADNEVFTRGLIGEDGSVMFEFNY